MRSSRTNHRYRARLRSVVSLWLLLAPACALCGTLPPYTISFTAATSAESALLMKSVGTSEANGVRHAAPGDFVVYGFPLTAGARCRLELMLNLPDCGRSGSDSLWCGRQTTAQRTR